MCTKEVDGKTYCRGCGNVQPEQEDYNRYVRKFPTSIFLNMTGYEKQAYSYLEYDVSEDAPQDLFGDK